MNRYGRRDVNAAALFPLCVDKLLGGERLEDELYFKGSCDEGGKKWFRPGFRRKKARVVLRS